MPSPSRVQLGASSHSPFRAISVADDKGDENVGLHLNRSQSLSYPLIAQQTSNTNPYSSTLSSGDMSNVLTGLVVILFLPLFWGPTRKAVGLVNIIVGTILTITGIGAIFGIPMIFVGGACLFI